jgi:hypothetical protein
MVTSQIPSAIGEPVSDPREDDEPVSIEADAPEADWIEQHQPIIDEDDGDVAAYTSDARDDDAVSIESDTPEADWIEQHQPIVEGPDEERLPSDHLPEEVVDAGEPEQDWIATDENIDPVDDQEIPTPAAAGGRGCNVLAAIALAVLRWACDSARQVRRRTREPRV